MPYRDSSIEPDDTTVPAPTGASSTADTFSIGMDDRYDSLQAISWWDQSRISAARIIVVGAGALGNEVVKNLALLGVGLVVIVDFDEIENSNLTRSVLFRPEDCGQPKAVVAAQMAMQINPDTKAIPLVGRIPNDIGLGLVFEVDLVIGCVDNREARLWINRMCWRAGKPWIDGGIQEINGVAKVFAPEGHPAHVPDRGCYECTMTENDYRLIQLRYSCPLLTRQDMLQGRVPTAPTIASIIGGLQVQEALKLIHEMPAATGSGLVFNGISNRLYQTHYPLRPDCMSHETARPVFESDLRTSRATPRELIRLAAERTGHRTDPAFAALQLDRDFVLSLVCDSCQKTENISRSSSKVPAAQARCIGCNSTRRPVMVHSIGLDPDGSGFSLLDTTLDQLGFPEFDIVRIRLNESNAAWIWLDSDRPDWLRHGSPTQEVNSG